MPLSREKMFNAALLGVALLIMGYLAYQMVLRAGLVRERVTLEPVAAPRADLGAIREFDIITVLGKDAIRAILDPRFITAQEAQGRIHPEESVIGLSIKGESKAYPTAILSAREIANDVVGGVPLAVTW